MNRSLTDASTNAMYIRACSEPDPPEAAEPFAHLSQKERRQMGEEGGFRTEQTVRENRTRKRRGRK